MHHAQTSNRQLLDEALFGGEPEPPPSPPIAVGSRALTQVAPGLYEIRETPAEVETRPEPEAPAVADEPATPVEEPPAEPIDEPLPLMLVTNAGLSLVSGEVIILTPEVLRVGGAAAELIDLVLLSPPEQGTLLRDGFAMAGGDVFTQDDIDQGRIHYRHEGLIGDDYFTFTTPHEEVPATEFAIEIRLRKLAPTLAGPGRLRAGEAVAVRDLLADTAQCHDPALTPGVAVVGVVGRGEWEAALDGETWRPLADVRPAGALLLAATSAIRFVPHPAWSGPVRLTYRAWDTTDHEAGDRVDLTARHAVGGTTAFSRETATAACRHQAARRSLPPAAEPWVGRPTAEELVGGGMAVVRLEGPGVWQFSLDDGVSWDDFGAVYHGRARLLGPADRVRFLPHKGAEGKVVLAARPWDGDGEAGAVVSLASHRACGPESAFGDGVRTRTWRLG